jgi:hypothetical protein
MIGRPEHEGLLCLGALAFTVVVSALAYAGFVRLHHFYPSAAPLGLAAALAFCAATSWVRIADLAPALRIYIRGCALVCGAYSLLLFPNFPTPADDLGGWTPTVFVVAWALAALAALCAMWRPTWLFFASFYIVWVKLYAGHATGFAYHTMLDVLPLYQAPAIVSLVVTAFAIAARLNSGAAAFLSRNEKLVAGALVLMAISTHAANYFYSGLAKTLLEGPPLYWLLNNDLRSFLRVALYEEQLLWGEIRGAPEILDAALGMLRWPMALAIFVVQIAAILAFFSKRLLVALFVAFDLMHLGIFVVVGANFWTWLTLNLVIIAAVRQLPAAWFGWRTGFVGAALILLAPSLVGVAKLGWIDTPAVNSLHFMVRDGQGRDTRVPFSFFGFYSYPLSHMSFGLPPGRYVPTLTNGGTLHADVAERAKDCAIEAEESASPFMSRWNPDAVTRFIRAYHRYVLRHHPDGGRWSHILYPHHFWSAPSVSAAFDGIDLRTVVAYVMRIDSVCLTAMGSPKVLAGTEFVIDVR